MVMLSGMTPAKQGAYRFRKESIAEMRQILGLSQSAMAAMLDLPKNTVSRWERGETTPDAESLAAIYSLGKEKGVEPNFFVSVKQKAPLRDAALVYWDIPSIAPVRVTTVNTLHESIETEVKRRAPQSARRLLKAFSYTEHSEVTDRMEKLGWRVWEDDVDWTDDIYEQALSDAGQNPLGSVVFLISAEGKHEELIAELRDREVRVYVITMYGPDVSQRRKMMGAAALGRLPPNDWAAALRDWAAPRETTIEVRRR